MKDFSMLPLDTSITNTENATNFNHYQTLNMEQSMEGLDEMKDSDDEEAISKESHEPFLKSHNQ